ncbi:MAG TPA: DUF362 domain-containing protein [Spirochaetota bacterium]|nr:DUF362 domain-containing protein [Spirochaetota bacterium]
MATVSLARCPEYSRDAIRGRMMRSLEEIGFDPNRFRGARVAMKPNLLLPAAPDKAIVTHPVFFEAALDIVIEHGGRPIVVESPALASVEKALRRSGYGPALDRTGVGVADATGTAIVHNERGVAFKRFEIIREVCDAEFIINLPKMKTHGLTYFTGAVKNYFGLVPGLEKAQWHLRAPTAAEFTSFLLDFYGAIRDGFSPRKTLLNIMDGICALEGEGPGPGGRARFVGVMLASEDAVALDAVASAVDGPNRVERPCRLDDSLKTAVDDGRGTAALGHHEIPSLAHDRTRRVLRWGGKRRIVMGIPRGSNMPTEQNPGGSVRPPGAGPQVASQAATKRNACSRGNSACRTSSAIRSTNCILASSTTRARSRRPSRCRRKTTSTSRQMHSREIAAT